MKAKLSILVIVALLVVLVPSGVMAQDERVELTFGSWRTDDIGPWEEILTVFHEAYPNIHINYDPTVPTEYDAQLRTALEGGVGPDIMLLRSYDRGLQLWEAGYLLDLTDLPGLDYFGPIALDAWNDGGTQYGVPAMSVLHGFLYNKDMFEEYGVEEPTTQQELLDVCQVFKDNGIDCFAMGTKDGWAPGVMFWDNVAPNYYGGDETRQALINGEIDFTDQRFVDAFAAVAEYAEYLPAGHEAISYPDTQQMFMIGLAPIFPAGSWEIPVFSPQIDFEMGFFPPPLPDDFEEGDTCYVCDHVDAGLGGNAATEHPIAVRTFLEWTTTAEFAQLFTDNLSGIFAMSEHDVEVDDPLAAEVLDLRSQCEGTIRIGYQYLGSGDPPLNTLLWNDATVGVLQGKFTPEEAAAHVAEGLATWYTPPGE